MSAANSKPGSPKDRAGECLAWESVDGDLFHSGVVRFDELDEQSSRVTVKIVWEPGGLVEKAASVLGLDDVQIAVDLERFKEHAEERAPRTAEQLSRKA